MKIKFIDSKNRIRSVLTDGNPKERYDDAVFEYSQKYGKTFEREMGDFLKTLPKEQIKNAKMRISSKTNTPESEIKNKEVITGDSALLGEYLRYLDTNFSFEKKIIKKFKWNENFVRNFDNRSQFDPNKLVTYDSIARNFSKLDLVNCYDTIDVKYETVMSYSPSENQTVPFKYGIYTVYLEGTEKDFDKLVEIIKEKCINSLKGSESGKAGDYSKAEYKHNLEEINSEYEEKIKMLQEDIDEFTESLNSGNYEDEEERQELIDQIEENKQEIEKEKELLKIQLENEKNNFEGNVDFVLTNEDIKEMCLSDHEEDEVNSVLSISEFNRRYPLTADSKDWYGAKDVKLWFNFEDSKIIRDGKVFNYFTVNKELEKHYYDSKEDISYEEWLMKNSNLINDTLTKLEKGGKPMNDSLKNLKFRFKDGIEIEVLDSEGKTFTEVKDEAIQVHRQIVKNSAPCDSVESDDKKETEKTLEKYGAIPSNEVNDSEAPVEDSVEKTSTDKYQVIVNGKEIGIYDTLEEAEEAENKALAAVEKGIPKVEVEDEDTSRAYEDDAEQAAYENARECLYYGVSKADWDSCDLPEEKANEIWKKAFKDLANEM